ncbi:MAG: hypothetical protein IKE41_01535, partial [Clostridia bacterium]|nr:hypothetical protein [Clostridia bacterium]
SRASSTYPSTDKMIEGIEKAGNTKLAEKLKKDLYWVAGLTVGELAGEYQGNNPEKFAEKNYAKTLGGQRCYAEAVRILEEKYKGDPFKFFGLSAEGPFMGDITEELKKCVDYTLDQLNTVINLGAKKTAIYGQNFQPSELGIDLETLIGSDYSKQREQWEAQTQTLKTTVTRSLGRKKESLHSQVEKEYEKVKAYQKKFFPEDRLAPADGTPYYKFSQLKVSLSSLRQRGGRKDYEIEQNHTELETYYNDAKSHRNDATQDDYDSLYIRKAEQFLAACQEWHKKRMDYENELETRKIDAADWLKEVKKHYNELRAEGKRINKEQKKANQLEHKEWKKILDKAYKRFPYRVSTFLKEFDQYKRMAEAFCLLAINTDMTAQRFGYQLSEGDRLIKYRGADESKRELLLGMHSIDPYFDAVRDNPQTIEQIKSDAEKAKTNPWNRVIPPSPPNAPKPPIPPGH